MKKITIEIDIDDPTDVKRVAEFMKKLCAISADVFRDTPIDVLELNARPYNCLRAENIDTLGKLEDTPRQHLITIPNLGYKSIAEIREKFDEYVKRVGRA